MMPIADLFSTTCLLIGAVFLLISAVGLLRLPDVFCRGHALGLASTLGIGLMLLALWLHVGGAWVGLKILLAIVLQFSSIPIASHLVGLVALQKGLPRYRSTDARRPMAGGRES